MPAPFSPLAEAEALFLSGLQPVLDLAALAAQGALAALGGSALVLVVGLAGRAASVWRGRRHPTHYPPTTPVAMTRSLLLFALLLLAAPSFAQTGSDAMARLAPYAGTYTLDGTAQIEGGSFDGALTVSPILGGHFQQWDWEMTMHGPDGYEEPVHLRFIAGYDAATGAYTVHRFDSRDAGSPTRSARAHDPAAGRLQVDGDALVMAWPTVNPEDGSKMGSFRNTVRLGAGGLTVVTDVVPDDGSPRVAIATTRADRR